MRWAIGMTIADVPDNPNPAKVLNLSLGAPQTCPEIYQNAIEDINAAGATIVVSAGNENQDAADFAPASCEGVISVAATGFTGNKADYSNYGSTIEISAPAGDLISGPNIWSTNNAGVTEPDEDSYESVPGTSVAAPQVTGLVSLLYSVNRSLTPSEVLYTLQNTATDFPAYSNCRIVNCGSGIINAGTALTWLKNNGEFPDPGLISEEVLSRLPLPDANFPRIAMNQGNISGNGRYVVFSTDSSNLVVHDSNNVDDVFVYDRFSGIISRVSVGQAGIQANNVSREPTISADGRYVAFRSYATNLVSDDTNLWVDAYVHDRVT